MPNNNSNPNSPSVSNRIAKIERGSAWGANTMKEMRKRYNNNIERGIIKDPLQTAGKRRRTRNSRRNSRKKRNTRRNRRNNRKRRNTRKH